MYGYITDEEEFKQEDIDIINPFDRKGRDGNFNPYIGIETSRNLNKDPNTVMFSSLNDFLIWRDQHEEIT